jgi:hypothetical protein
MYKMPGCPERMKPEFIRRAQRDLRPKILSNIFCHGQPMSMAPCKTGGMNMKKMIGIGSAIKMSPFKARPRLIAIFGTARLMRQPNGRHELVGGSAADCTEAREWCSLFAPAVVFGAAHRDPAVFATAE